MDSKKQIVFISCGQYTEREKALGNAIAALVEMLTPFSAYFAENQNTLKGFTENILGALNRCAGFIGVMHQRGTVRTPQGDQIRGSVWIEQEIAVAAFLEHMLKRDIKVCVYFERGVTREGMRDKLLLNEKEFQNDPDVIADLKRILPEWKPTSLQTTPISLRCYVEQMKPQISLLRFINDSEEQVRIRQIRFEWDGHDLIDPYDLPEQVQLILPPGIPRICHVAHDSSPIAPLIKMNPNEGIFFQLDLFVIVVAEASGGRQEVRMKRRVKVCVSSAEAKDLGNRIGGS